MSVDLDRQLREYCRYMDEKQGALSFDDILERSGDQQVVPRVIPGRRNQHPSSPRKWIAAAAVALVVLITAIGVRLLPIVNGTPPPADHPPTTLAPAVETMSDLAVIEAGVAAFYSGDGERAAELFELSDRTDEQIREEAAYQEAISGRLDVNCREQARPGRFSCTTPYHNALTDAIGFRDSPGDMHDVVVEDGVITAFAFPEHTFILVPMGIFLATEGRFDGYEVCAFGPFPASCATVQLENLDAWMEWRENLEAANVVEVALESWYGGDCVEAMFLFEMATEIDTCSTPDPASQTIQYESLLGADVSVGCAETSQRDRVVGDRVVAYPSCEVHYSNAMNIAVGKPPSVTVRAFAVDLDWGQVVSGWGPPSNQADYPEDTELRESFALFAEGGELSEAYADAGCASAHTPDCANLIMDNLDEWAAWYQTNS